MEEKGATETDFLIMILVQEFVLIPQAPLDATYLSKYILD